MWRINQKWLVQILHAHLIQQSAIKFKTSPLSHWILVSGVMERLLLWRFVPLLSSHAQSESGEFWTQAFVLFLSSFFAVWWGEYCLDEEGCCCGVVLFPWRGVLHLQQCLGVWYIHMNVSTQGFLSISLTVTTYTLFWVLVDFSLDLFLTCCPPVFHPNFIATWDAEIRAAWWHIG